MKKRWNILAMILCTSLFVAGCTEKTPNSGTNTASANNTNNKADEKQSNLDVLQPGAYGNVQGLSLEKGTTISIIGRGSSSAYWTEVKVGAEKAIADINSNLGYKGEDKVKLTYSAPETEDDVDDQVNILDEELARYPAALGIAAVDSEACEVQFDLAAENGIPVVAFDSGTNYQDIVSMIDTNNVEAASMAANKLSDMIDDQGEVMMLVHDNKSTSAHEREDGFRSTIEEKHSEIQIVESYHLDELELLKQQIEQEKSAAEDENDSNKESGTSENELSRTDENKEDIQENQDGAKEEEAASDEEAMDMTQEDAVKYLLEKHPDVKGIYTTNETTAKLVISVLKNLEIDDVTVVSFDGGKDQLKRLEDGDIEGLIVQNPYGIGYATVVACARAILGQGNEAEVNAGYTWVTQDNLNDESIQKMMY